ncbi:hypothetical protein GKC29_22070 [Micromonospora sp. WMMC415]|uniref:hypothetical protein n=1 Tax=Micromonospora sp. WMMC415 TaxID=2675222 RepID=UPI0012B4510C|nr:hypothetical protein [Micromonospora sp. WMMC415]QGN49241.1 hypothetical protein GKC29_22070 [Micromonospora sp. WMMC415]
MMRDLSSEIIDLLSPRPVPSEWQWERAESEIGARVPRDYKALVAGLGGACIVDDCLCLFEPDSRETHKDFANLVAERDSAWQHIRARGLRPVPEKYFSEGNRLIAFALVEANYFYWIASPDKPEDQWGVLIVDADLEDWYEFGMSATECIYNILVGEIEFPVFEGLFDDSPHAYSRS